MAEDFERRFQGLFAEVERTPRLYLHKLSWVTERAYLVEADRGFFERAAFLDDRALAGGVPGLWVPLARLRTRMAAAESAPPPPCHFIFHVGHCGSTLIARLLGRLPTALVLREPHPLRGLADAYRMLGQPDSLLSPERTRADLALVYRLLARTFGPEETAVVKTTSACSNLGPDLMARNAANRALLLAVGPEAYLAGVQSHLVDVRGFAPMRLRSLRPHLDGPEVRLYELSNDELAALSWAAEVVNQHLVAKSAGEERSLRVDFDAFLSDPGGWLARICRHLGQPAEARDVELLLDSGLMARSAKQPERPFDAADRARRLDRARERHGPEIAAGLSFAARLARDHRIVAEAVEASGYALG